MGLPHPEREMCKLGNTAETEESWGFKVKDDAFKDFVYLRGGTGLILTQSLTSPLCLCASCQAPD